MPSRPFALLLAATLALAPLLSPAQNKPRIEKAADLPRFTYTLDAKAEDVVRSPERFGRLATQLRRDVQSVLDGHDIADKATQRDLLRQLAALDFLDGRYDAAIERSEQIRALEDKPADKLLSGLRLRAMAAAAKTHAVGSEAYARAVGAFIAKEIGTLPRDVVINSLREAKAGAETMGEGRPIGYLREAVQPVIDKNGALSSDFAPALLNVRLTLTAVLPLKQTLIDTYGAWLKANEVVKPDIWAARDAALPARKGAKPVVIAVWDSGSETALFGPQVARGRDGKPLVIAFDKYSKPAAGELFPVPAEMRGRLPLLQGRSKGFSDLQANIDSPEAAEVKRFLSTLAPEQYKAEIEQLIMVGNYEHGTHVAGIALAGNPQARLLVSRIEFGHTLLPDPCPSRELAERGARAVHDYVAFFKKHDVRVVNMSWGGSVGGYESQLEQCGIGKGPEERKAIARSYFEIDRKALTEAMAGAPGIVFVAAAGNSNDDASFIESLPSAIALPNLLTVGAVDQAGDEASFTSYGPTVRVHANGYQVESFLPGGKRVALSGTSMASPQVAALAGKILALHPTLKPAEVISLIVDTAERTADGRRNLIHPKKALAAAAAKG